MASYSADHTFCKQFSRNKSLLIPIDGVAVVGHHRDDRPALKCVLSCADRGVDRVPHLIVRAGRADPWAQHRPTRRRRPARPSTSRTRQSRNRPKNCTLNKYSTDLILPSVWHRTASHSLWRNAPCHDSAPDPTSCRQRPSRTLPFTISCREIN